MAYKAAVLLLLLSSNLLVIRSSEVGSIATIQRYNGEHLGPYIVKDFHSHGPDEPNAIAQPLTGEEEGSGDYSALYDYNEDGDDTGSGVLTIQDLANILRPKEEEKSETILKPMIVPSLKEVSEWVFVGDFLSTQPSSPPSPSTKQPSEPSTLVPSPQAPLQPTTPTPPPLAPSSTASPGCHESCVSLLEAVTLQALPQDVSFVREGEGVRLTCSVSVAGKEQEELLEQIQLNWLFQGEMPPASECSLDGQRYLAACEGFASVWEEQQRNATHLMADILFTKLRVTNTGRYLCQVAANCCGSLPQRQLQYSVTVWQADYTIELAVVITVGMVMTTVLLVTLMYKRRLAENRSREYKKMFMVSSSDLPSSGGKVLHLPLQEEDFDDRDSFTSEDSAYP